MGKWNWSIRTNLYMLFILAFMLPMMVISIGFTWYYSAQMEKQIDRNVSNILGSLSKNIQISCNELEQISFAPFLYKDVLDTMIFLKNGFHENPPDFIYVAGYESTYNVTFSKLMYTSSESIQNITFYPMSENDKICYRISRNAAGLQPTLTSTGYSSEDWFIKAQEHQGTPIFLPIFSDATTNNRPCFSLVRMIRDPDSRKDIGVLRIDASADSLTNLIADMEIAGNSRVLLVDENSQVICQTKDVSDSLIAQLAQGNSTISDGSGTYLVMKEPIKTAGWHLVYLNSITDIQNSQLLTCGFALLATLIAGAAAFLLYRKKTGGMIASVNDILGTIKSIQRGNLSAKSRVKDENELGLISQAVNKMGDKLSLYIDREYKAVISQKNAEYLALQAQINPHFLYNTLNGFIALNRMGERKTLENAIIQLTYLFRYTCNNNDLTTVELELKFCERYLKLQKLQFDERLEFSIFIDPQTEKHTIPKLIVQPLVENCIVHGMGETDAPLLIEISSQKLDDVIEIRVKDNGVGFDKEKLTQAPPRVGLKNIEERLSFFRSDASITLHSSPGMGTDCIIKIPIE